MHTLLAREDALRRDTIMITLGIAMILLGWWIA